MDLADLPAGQRLGLCFLFGACMAVPYIRMVISRAAPGPIRVAVSVPLCMGFLASPFCFNLQEEVLERLVIMFIFSWLASFKVWCKAARQRS